MAKREWILKRNCSISPRQLAMVYTALCSVSLIIAIFFTVRGAWLVLGFAILEMSAVGLAFFQYARHATDREHIALIDDCLLVELIQRERARQFRLDPRWTRVELPDAPHELITLEAKGMRVEVGRFLTVWKRREFAQELRRELQYALMSGGQAEF
jgi:uncharacterized membrane protein